jgi:hypothetical protein
MNEAQVCVRQEMIKVNKFDLKTDHKYHRNTARRTEQKTTEKRRTVQEQSRRQAHKDTEKRQSVNKRARKAKNLLVNSQHPFVTRVKRNGNMSRTRLTIPTQDKQLKNRRGID